MSFKTILEKYREISYSKLDKGRRFERLMQAYLQTDPQFAHRFKNVWLWNEFPGKADLGGSDTGIDLVALTLEGDYWAIQCKFFQQSTYIDKPAVDSFLTTSGRSFKGLDLKTTHFQHRLWISTTNNWTSNAQDSIKNQTPPVSRISLSYLMEAPVDWEKLDEGISGVAALNIKRDLKAHQVEALEKTHEHFKNNDRGKLIMACGTGKTFNALRIAEKQTEGNGLVLFLVPSIALLGQTLREWTSYANEPINPICICSDPEISRKKSQLEDSDGFSVVDLALPASTNVKDIIDQFQYHALKNTSGMMVVFSTYQSIEVISKAQKQLSKVLPRYEQFDLIICDEAHRTTGVSLDGDDESAFTKVHNNDFIKSKKRLYMTATPRLYSDEIKSKAAQAEAVLCSMDDEKLYGNEIYRIGFGEAVDKDLLTDYKVLILTLSESDVPPAVQKMIADKDSEINTDDASKLIGCINALSKQILGDEGIVMNSDPEPMRRAVAFCQNIKTSKKITSVFNLATDAYVSSLPPEKKELMVEVASKHIDGTMGAPQRDELLAWLKEEGAEKECRILTNVRCLSEGVDVPSLDSVLFLSARNSQVDVVQSVGRVMRKSPGKKYGYIIIPVLVPSDVDAAKAMDNNERFKVVWTVLNALRAHDDRFNATINKIELNQKKPEQILIGAPPVTYDSDGNSITLCDEPGLTEKYTDLTRQLTLQFNTLQQFVFARMVQKVGDKRYWEQWAKNVAEIAERQVIRIERLIQDGGKHKEAFENFLEGLQKNINPSIDQKQAIEMLSQHIITKPVFEALFEDYSFVKSNPISIAMQTMLDLLEEQAIEKDTETLQKFYESVKMRASGIDNAEGKQRIIIELYDKFFKTAFPKLVEKLGIVYTPIEVVDFIIQSVNDILIKEFGRSLSDENIHILDPFTGTGTFITRLLQSGVISRDDLLRKYTQEIHCNEIVLLAYYIAAVNIENAFHDLFSQKGEYKSFEGICLTDTFQLGETGEADVLFSDMFPQNSNRVLKQKKSPLRVIMGNPPYSIGQKSANDNAANQTYPKLDNRIAETYAKQSSAGLNKSLYDAYIKAFRWSSDRLDKTGGIICFVSNGAWLDGNSTDGFRRSIEKEFSSIYIFNLRGNARTQGELRRKEAGNIFGSGSRTPIAITLLVKNPDVQDKKAKIYYHDIGDYLDREQKLKIIKKFRTFKNPNLTLSTLKPNEHGDWLSMRSSAFDSYIPIEPDKKQGVKSPTFFTTKSVGSVSSRDSWVYNFSKSELRKNISRTIEYYNEQRELIFNGKQKEPLVISEKGSWSRDWKNFLRKNKMIIENKDEYRVAAYRPFVKTNFYFDDDLNQERYQLPKLFPSNESQNIAITVSSMGSNKGLSIFITNLIPDFHYIGDTHCFPLYYYEKKENVQRSLFDSDDIQKFVRRDAISDFILERAKQQYVKTVTKEDIFYYVYGILHSKVYRETFANDLKKMLPRLPLVEDKNVFWLFRCAGRKLAELHLNYETVAPFLGVTVNGDDGEHYMVTKMRFPKKDQKGTIHYNSKITVSNIPSKAYEYVVNGKSAIEWIMERYLVTTHKESGIINDPNDWAKEVGNPRYILDLLLSIINVSVQTVDIVNGLPKLKFD